MARKRLCRLVLLAMASAYLAALLVFELPSLSSNSGGSFPTTTHLPRRRELEASVDSTASPLRPEKPTYPLPSPRAGAGAGAPSPPRRRRAAISAVRFHRPNSSTAIDRSASAAFSAGAALLSHLRAGAASPAMGPGAVRSCPASIWLSVGSLTSGGNIIELPCGLTPGSHITVVGRPRAARPEYAPRTAERRDGEPPVMVSQFMVELVGIKAVDGEEPPRILHLNPRIKGDYSGRPVIEQNTCYRMQWGQPQRCEGWASRADEETVDGEVKCEKWIPDDDSKFMESKMRWWFNRMIGRPKKVSVDWPYPFVEGKLFVLTLTAGLEGYHVNVDGRHVTSFPYRTGFSLEDATGLSLNGDLDIESIFASSLPDSHPSFAPQRHLEMLEQWKAPPLPSEPIELFIGIISAGNHFAERMAVRKSWMIAARKSSNIVARFFVALNGRKEVNALLKKEAEFFGDIVIVPFLDNYDLVVLKTIAICEYGVRVVPAKYIMKCDDDTFVRIDSVMDQVRKVQSNRSVYVGNMNYYHKPLRTGKWAVTYEEWPEEVYPSYANGPGYVVSSDIARYIVSEFDKQRLRLFKMEDVSMGMWIEKFNTIHRPVEYLHDFKFFQSGCTDGYYTAHYQSPQHMICLWGKLQSGSSQCCNI